MKRRFSFVLILSLWILSVGMGLAAYRAAAQMRVQIPTAICVTTQGTLPYPPMELWEKLSNADAPVGCALEYAKPSISGAQAPLPLRYANPLFGDLALFPLIAGHGFSDVETPAAILNEGAFARLFPGKSLAENSSLQIGKTAYRVVGLWEGMDDAAVYVNQLPEESTPDSLLFLVDCSKRQMLEAEVLDFLSEAIGFPLEGQTTAVWAYREIPTALAGLGVTVSLIGLALLLLFESVGVYLRGYRYIVERNSKWSSRFTRAILLSIAGIGAFWVSLLFIHIPNPLLPAATIFDFSHYARIYLDFISQGGFLSEYAHRLSATVPWIVGLSIGMTLSFWAGLAVCKMRMANSAKPD